MKHTGLAIWSKFKSAFISEFAKLNEKEKSRLLSSSDRKYFLKSFLSQIAKNMDLAYDENKEFLRVDYTLFKPGTKYKWSVPLIFIESENSWDSSYEEVLKLASLNAPLKILILYGMDDNKEKWLRDHDNDWDYILPDFVEEHQLVGLFVVLIYSLDKMNRITFHSILYDEKGVAGELEEIKADGVNDSTDAMNLSKQSF